MRMLNRPLVRAFPTKSPPRYAGGFYLVPFGVGGMAIYDLRRFYVSVQYIFGVVGKWVFGELDTALSAKRSWEMEQRGRGVDSGIQ